MPFRSPCWVSSRIRAEANSSISARLPGPTIPVTGRCSRSSIQDGQGDRLLGGRKVSVAPARARYLDGSGEVELNTYAHFEELLEESAREHMVVGSPATTSRARAGRLGRCDRRQGFLRVGSPGSGRREHGSLRLR
jgi:hypothetical protein